MLRALAHQIRSNILMSRDEESVDATLDGAEIGRAVFRILRKAPPTPIVNLTPSFLPRSDSLSLAPIFLFDVLETGA